MRPRACIRRACTIALLLSSTPALADTLEVGPGQTYAAPCAAFAAAQDGDTIEIDAAGNYDGDVCAVTANGLTIRGVNGLAHIRADGQNAQGKATWVVQGDDTRIESIEFSGATVPDQNGAGIRQEGTNLTLVDCSFHDNENGILAGADPESEILIESCEFARNGYGDGYTHNMYIGAVKKFTLRYSYSHSASIGHLVKSRALENHILYNRLTGEADGTESYEINLPDAGTSYVIGNLIHQGPDTDNSVMIDYASESAANPGHDLYVVNNTIVNERGGDALFVSVGAAVTTPAVVKNNVFVGPGTAVNQGSAVQEGNVATDDALFVDPSTFDYRIMSGSPCEDAGVDPGSSASSFSLMPSSQYVHPLGFEGRVKVGTIDVGAYELGGGVASGGAGPGDGGNAGASASGGSSSGGSATSGGSSAGGNVTAGGSGTGGSGTSTGAGGSAGMNGAASGSDDDGACGCRSARRSGSVGALGWVTLLVVLGRRRSYRRDQIPARG